MLVNYEHVPLLVPTLLTRALDQVQSAMEHSLLSLVSFFARCIEDTFLLAFVQYRYLNQYYVHDAPLMHGLQNQVHGGTEITHRARNSRMQMPSKVRVPAKAFVEACSLPV